MKKSINFIYLKGFLSILLVAIVFNFINWNVNKQDEIFEDSYSDTFYLTEKEYSEKYSKHAFKNIPGEGIYVQIEEIGTYKYKRAFTPYFHKTLQKDLKETRFKRVKDKCDC